MNTTSNDLKWFGEGFDGFPKRLPDDCIEYSIYILDSMLQDSTLREQLQQVQKTTHDLTKTLLKEYIWQRDPFRLELVQEDGLSLLRGKSNYGDSVEDEWLVVYILRHLSVRFPELWIKTIDTDGEFLLIEAANALPPWINPEIAENRVWISRGHLLIIPHYVVEKGRHLSGALTPREAHQFIMKDSSRMLLSPSIEAEAFYRLRNYPEQISDNLHHASVKIPRRLVYVLHDNAAYISPAVEAFYLRDPIALRPLQLNVTENFAFPPKDLVTTTVKFTKVGFAQLKSQLFPTPPSWADVLAKASTAKSMAEADLGMKVTAGFEMLVSDPQNQDRKDVREIELLLEDICSGEEKLPSDETIQSWAYPEDNEAWLEIDFNDFEKELAGKGAGFVGGKGFGDTSKQGIIRKMVSRFEDFLNDDDVGSEGDDSSDDTDMDTDEDGSSIVSETEDKELIFDEVQFATMMREMMGLQAETESARSSVRYTPVQPLDCNNGETHDAGDSNEDEEIRQLTEAMEAELQDAGVLKIDDASVASGLDGNDRKLGPRPTLDSEGESETEDKEIDLDYHLAKNLLESFKSQAGMAGPGGNLMGLMGVQMPLDKDDCDDTAGGDG